MSFIQIEHVQKIPKCHFFKNKKNNVPKDCYRLIKMTGVPVFPGSLVNQNDWCSSISRIPTQKIQFWDPTQIFQLIPKTKIIPKHILGQPRPIPTYFPHIKTMFSIKPTQNQLKNLEKPRKNSKKLEYRIKTI